MTLLVIFVIRIIIKNKKEKYQCLKSVFLIVNLPLAIANYFKLPFKIYQDKSIYGLHYNKDCSEYLEKRLYKNAHYYLQRKYEIAQRSFNSPLTLEDVKENPLNCGEPLRA